MSYSGKSEERAPLRFQAAILPECISSLSYSSFVSLPFAVNSRISRRGGNAVVCILLLDTDICKKNPYSTARSPGIFFKIHTTAHDTARNPATIAKKQSTPPCVYGLSAVCLKISLTKIMWIR